MFCNAANENFSIYGNGVYWMESSRSRFRPRNANGRMEEILLRSRVSLRKTRRPANASPFITGKLFFVNESSSTVSGNCCVGISSRPPVLQSTWKFNRSRSRGRIHWGSAGIERFPIILEDSRDDTDDTDRDYGKANWKNIDAQISEICQFYFYLFWRKANTFCRTIPTDRRGNFRIGRKRQVHCCYA